MNCNIADKVLIYPKDAKGSDGRMFSGDLDEIVNTTQNRFRTLSLDVEHNRGDQVGFINTDTLYHNEIGIFGQVVYQEGYDSSNFKGLSPTLGCLPKGFGTIANKVIEIRALTLTDDPNFKGLVFERKQMEITQAQFDELKQENEKLLAMVVEQRNASRNTSIEKMIAVDANLGHFRVELLSKDDEEFNKIYSAVSEQDNSKEEVFIEQDNKKQNTEQDSVSKNIMRQLRGEK